MFLFSLPVTAYPDWKVLPIRLDLAVGAKSGVVTVVNDGDQKLHLQIKALEWLQDAEGKDQYKETSDIVYYPKMLVLNEHDEKVIRVGLKAPSVTKENTYRLFIEEIPEPKKTPGTNISVAIRFGVPIFAMPVKAESKGEIEGIEMSKGSLKIIVKNPGTVHYVITSIAISGKNSRGDETFARELSGWYLLNGVSRPYTTQIPEDVCKGLTRLDIEVKTKEFSFDGKLDVDKAMCLP